MKKHDSNKRACHVRVCTDNLNSTKIMLIARNEGMHVLNKLMYMYTCTGLQYLNLAKIIHLNKKTIAMPFPIYKIICLKMLYP